MLRRVNATQPGDSDAMNDKDKEEDNHGWDYEPNDPNVFFKFVNNTGDLFGDYPGLAI